jgi:hypothetical protein
MANNVIILKSIFLFCSIWGIAILLLWFRSRIELFWKLVATCIFIFYIWFFFNEFSLSFNSFKADWYISIIEFFKEILVINFAGMFIIWPAILIIIFYKANDIGSEKLLRFICLLTIILWIAFIIYFFFSSGVENFFYETLKKTIPKAG